MAPRWEYKRIHRTRKPKGAFRTGVSYNPWSLEVDENKLGEEGWELVSIVPYASDCNFEGYTTDEMSISKRLEESIATRKLSRS